MKSHSAMYALATCGWGWGGYHGPEAWTGPPARLFLGRDLKTLRHDAVKRPATSIIQNNRRDPAKRVIRVQGVEFWVHGLGLN